jgi:hypothetical protein
MITSDAEILYPYLQTAFINFFSGIFGARKYSSIMLALFLLFLIIDSILKPSLGVLVSGY